MTDARTTQIGIEEWGDGSPVARTTQISVEMWAESLMPTGLMRVWNGTQWTYKPVKYWTGSAWAAKPLKVWDGSNWVLS